MIKPNKITKNKTSLNVIARLDEDGRLRLSSKDEPHKSDGMIIEVSRRTDAYDSLLASLGHEKTSREDYPEVILNSDNFISNDSRRIPIGIDTYGFTVYWDVRYGSHLKIESKNRRGSAGRTSMVKNILEHVRRNSEKTEAYVFSSKGLDEYSEYGFVDNVSVNYLNFNKIEDTLKGLRSEKDLHLVDSFKETFLIFDTNEGLSRTSFKNAFIEDIEEQRIDHTYGAISAIMTQGRKNKISILSTSDFQEINENDYPTVDRPTTIFLEGIDHYKDKSASYFGRIIDGTKSPEFKALFPKYLKVSENNLIVSH